MTGGRILLVLGGVLEFFGIVAVAWPDLLPYRDRLSASLRRAYARNLNRVRRVLRLPGRVHAVSATAVASSEVAGRLSVTRGLPEGASLDETIAFLIERQREAQERLNVLTNRIDEAEETTRRVIRQSEERAEARLTEALTEALERYRPLRVAGTVALGAGLACTIAASFL